MTTPQQNQNASYEEQDTLAKSIMSGSDHPAPKHDGKEKMSSAALLQVFEKKERLEKSIQPDLFRRTTSLIPPPKRKSCLEYVMDTVCLSPGDVEDPYVVDDVSY